MTINSHGYFFVVYYNRNQKAGLLHFHISFNFQTRNFDFLYIFFKPIMIIRWQWTSKFLIVKNNP